MIELKNVQKEFGDKNNKSTILTDVNLKLEDSGMIMIVGESGSGKSTLLNIIGGLDKITSGKYLLDGEDVSKISENKWSAIRQNKFGFIFQSYNLITHLTIFENVELELELTSFSKKRRKELVKSALEDVSMWDKKDYYPSQLSGGQQQRVAIARALVHEPEVILADEPTGALDTENAEMVMSSLKKIAANGKLVLLITHSKEFLSLADQVITIKDGKLTTVQTQNIQVSNAHNQKIKGKRLSLKSIFKMTFRNLKQRKKRAVLTALGSAIGIISVLLISYFSSGVSQYINSNLKVYSSNNILMIGQKDNGLITEKERNKISSLNGISKTYTDFTYSANISANGHQYSSMVFNTVPEKEIYLKDDLLEGKYPVTDSEVMIPEKMAIKLFGSSAGAIGKKVDMTVQISYQTLFPTSNINGTIVGITRDKLLDQLNIVYLSHDLAEVAVNQSPETKAQSNSLLLIMNSKEATEKVKNTLKKQGYFAITPEDDLEKGNQYVTVIFIFLGLIAGISLLVASIMIAIVVYVSVLERQKEIGILRAMGAYPKDIQRIFITEGGLLGALGGIIGIFVSILAGYFLNMILLKWGHLEMDLIRYNFIAIFLAFVLSCLLGMLLSFVPARKAAKKRIVTTLNH